MSSWFWIGSSVSVKRFQNVFSLGLLTIAQEAEIRNVRKFVFDLWWAPKNPDFLPNAIFNIVYDVILLGFSWISNKTKFPKICVTDCLFGRPWYPARQTDSSRRQEFISVSTPESRQHYLAIFGTGRDQDPGEGICRCRYARYLRGILLVDDRRV